MDSPIRTGLAGFGMASKTFHAPLISATPGLKLAAIVERHGEEAKRSYPDAVCVRSIDELLEDTSIRLVVIATPNASHYELARRVLEAGRHVVVDKPFTATAQEAHELTALARQTGRLLSVHHNRRWDGDFLTVRKLIADGTLGRLAMFESHYDRYRPALRPHAWREQGGAGSGVLWDLGSHLIDQALVLFGVPDSINASVRKERTGAVSDDAFDIHLAYSGLTVWLRATMLAVSPGPRFLLQGELGTYRKFGMDPQEDALKAGQIPGGKGWGVETPERWGTLSRIGEGGVDEQKIPTEPGNYPRYYANIRDAITLERPLEATAEQACRVMEMLEFARESSVRGCRISVHARRI